MVACSVLRGVSVLLLIVASGLTAAGLATDYWIDYGGEDGNEERINFGLFKWLSLENNDPGWYLAIPCCMIMALALSVILLFTYFCVCCCQGNRGRSCLLYTQIILLFMAATASAAALVVSAWIYALRTEIFGFSYYMAAAGSAVYILTAIIVMLDYCGQMDPAIHPQQSQGSVMEACSVLTGVSVLLLLVASGLTAAGVATDYWVDYVYEYEDVVTTDYWIDFVDEYEDEERINLGLFKLYSLEYSYLSWDMAIPCGMIMALVLSAILLFTYFCVFSCQGNRRRSCPLCTQIILLFMAATASAAALVASAWIFAWRTDIFGSSYFMVAAGSAVYVLTAIIVMADYCCGQKLPVYRPQLPQGSVMVECSILYRLSVLLLIVASCLTVAGVATDNWFKLLFLGLGLFQEISPGNNDHDWLLATRYCMIVTLVLSAILLFTYFCACCCQGSGFRSCLLCTQIVLLFMAATSSAAALAVSAWKYDWDFGMSYDMAAAGSAFYVLAAITVMVDLCRGRRPPVIHPVIY